MKLNHIYNENCLDTLRRMPDGFLDCVVTSPPYYGLRDYGHDDQIGLEATFHEYLDRLIEIFAEVFRALKDTGTVWVNLGDSYSGTGSKGEWRDPKYQNGRNGQAVSITQKVEGIKNKSLLNIPNRFAIRMTDELQFIQRNEIIWWKPSAMPSSAKDRFTVDFEKIFFFTKSEKYYFEQQLEPVKKISLERVKSGWKSNHDSIGKIDVQEMGVRFANPNGRNMRTTWRVPFEPQSANHYASYPTRLVETPIKAGCPVGGIVYDPFAGTATTLVVAHKLGRKWIGSEINAEYCEIANRRLEPYLMQETLF